MNKFPGSIKVCVSVAGLPDCYSTALMTGKTPEATVEKLNRAAKRKGVPATYKLATEEEYWEYRNSIKTAA